MSLNAAIFRLERRIVAASTLLMGTVVFLDVVYRVASRESRLFAGRFGDPALEQMLGTTVDVALAYVLAYGVVRTRGGNPGPRSWAKAALGVAVLYGALQVFLWAFPNGLIWSQTLGLVLMLWVGCIGASMATQENRHLSLDLGARLWPKSLLPYVQGVGNVVTAAFCLVLALLALHSIRSHFGDYQDTGGAGGNFVALPIPKWLAFTVIPATFALMALRFAAQAVESFRGHVHEEDALQMLGMEDDQSRGEATPQ